MVAISRREKIFGVVVIPIIFFLVYVIGNWQTREYNRRIFRDQCKIKWAGIATQKYSYRGLTIIIDSIEGQWKIDAVSSSLYDSVRIGDTLIKEANSNHCTILRGRKIDCDCYYYE